MEKQRKPGARVLIGDRVAIVESRKAIASGVQAIRFEDGRGLLSGFEWWDWQRLAQLPDAPQEGQE